MEEISRPTELLDLPAELLSQTLCEVLYSTNFADFLGLRLTCAIFDHEVQRLVITRDFLDDTEQRKTTTRSHRTWAHNMPSNLYADYLQNKVLVAKKDKNHFIALTDRMARTLAPLLAEQVQSTKLSPKAPNTEAENNPNIIPGLVPAIRALCVLYTNIPACSSTNKAKAVPGSAPAAGALCELYMNYSACSSTLWSTIVHETTDQSSKVNEVEVAAGVAVAAAYLDLTDVVISAVNSIGQNKILPQSMYYGSILIAAVSGGHLELTQMLLNRGAKPAWYKINEKSTRSLACLHGHLEIVNLLSRSVHVPSGHGTITDFLVDTITQTLAFRPAPSTADYHSKILITAAGYGHASLVAHSIACGGDVEYTTSYLEYHTPLTLACGHGHTDVVRLLLARGANPFGAGPPHHRPMDQAAEHGHVEVARLLLQAGVDVMWPRLRGESSWAVLAAKRGHLRMVEFLLQQRLDVDRADGQRGIRIAKAAARSGYVSIVRVLLEAGFDPLTVVEEAREHGQTHVVRAFEGTLPGAAI